MLLRTVVRRCAAASRHSAADVNRPSVTNVAEEFVHAANVVRFNAALAAINAHAVPRATVDALLKQHGVAADHLEKLEQAGTVFLMDDLVHCHPPALLMEAHAIRAGTAAEAVTPDPTAWDPCASMRQELAKASTERDQLRPAFDEVVAKAAKRRKLLWGGAVCTGGAQLAVISRLTYFDLDWDIMEPVSYFLGTGTSLCFFLFMLRYGAECTPRFFDEVHVGPYAKEDAVVNYLAACDKVRLLEAIITRKEAWMRDVGAV
jgi:hypothetical protein